MDPLAAIDLAWFLGGDFECAIGIRSSHANLVAHLEGVRGSRRSEPSDEEMERRAEAVQRARRVEETLLRCSARTRRVLAAYHRPDKRSNHWRELTHVLELTGKYSRKEHGPTDGGLGLRVEHGVATPAQREAATVIRRAAEVLAWKALAEYGAHASKAAGAHRFGTKPPHLRGVAALNAPSANDDDDDEHPVPMAAE